MKGSSYAVGKAPENLTPHQREVLEQIRNTNKRYYNAYDMKEKLRMILKMRNKVEAELYLKKWHWRASHSRIESFKELARKIKLVIRRAYGFRNSDSMIDMIYLVCSDINIPLPNRPKVLMDRA